MRGNIENCPIPTPVLSGSGSKGSLTIRHLRLAPPLRYVGNYNAEPHEVKSSLQVNSLETSALAELLTPALHDAAAGAAIPRSDGAECVG